MVNQPYSVGELSDNCVSAPYIETFAGDDGLTKEVTTSRITCYGPFTGEVKTHVSNGQRQFIETIINGHRSIQQPNGAPLNQTDVDETVLRLAETLKAQKIVYEENANESADVQAIGNQTLRELKKYFSR